MAKLLIIDDYKILRELYSGLLIKEGFEVDSAKDGNEGLEFLKKNDYNLILVDLLLQNSSANEVIILFQKELQSKSIKPIIGVMYTLGSEGQLEEIRKLGIDVFILKSTTNHEQLVEQIKKLISG